MLFHVDCQSQPIHGLDVLQELYKIEKKTARIRLGTYPIWFILTKVPCFDGKINLFAIEYALTHKSKALYTKPGLSIGSIMGTFIDYLPQLRILPQKVRFTYFPLNGTEDFFLRISFFLLWPS